MKKLILLFLVAVVCSAAPTTVADVLKTGSGDPITGSIYLTPSVPFISQGIQIYPVPIVVQIASDGSFSVPLYPNDTATPAGTSYRARYTLDGPPGFSGQTPVETWVVPTSASPVTLAVVRTSPAPTPSVSGYITSLNGLSSVTQLFARVNDTNVTLAINSATSTHTFTMGWTGLLAAARGGTGAGALTLGSVPFIGASGVYSQDNANFFYDPTNHRLGIGTTTFPDTVTKLNLVGVDNAVGRIASASGNNFAELVVQGGGGGGSGDNADIAFGVTGAGDLWRVGGVWNGARKFAVRDSLSSYAARLLIQPSTGNILIGPVLSESDNNTKFSVLSSGSAGTVLIQDQRPILGVTSIGVVAGAGQGTTNLMLMQGSTYQGIWDSQGQFSGGIIGGARTVSMSAFSGANLISTLTLNWRNGTNLDSGAVDLGIGRNAANVAEINNGTSGTLANLRLLYPIFTATTASDSLLANSQCTMILTSNTNVQFRCKGSDATVRHGDITIAP